ncbi:MAG: domain containing protein [Verrucomicrobiales bacterium]|nr:domain containing protein [Verrucomicrobiales bacterium]
MMGFEFLKQRNFIMIKGVARVTKTKGRKAQPPRSGRSAGVSPAATSSLELVNEFTRAVGNDVDPVNSMSQLQPDPAAGEDARTPKTLNLERGTLTCDARRVRRRWKILSMAACGLIAVVAVCFFCLREREPSYNGRTLSEWLQRYDPHSPWWIDGVAVGVDSAAEDEAAKAVRQIGTNALPTLVGWVAAEDGTLRIGCTTALQRWHPVQWVQRLLWNASADLKHEQAVSGFSILGTNASPAIPTLKTLLHSQNSSVATTATNALVQIDRGFLIQCYGLPVSK